MNDKKDLPWWRQKGWWVWVALAIAFAAFIFAITYPPCDAIGDANAINHVKDLKFMVF